MPENLTPKQQIFCDEYLIDFNAKRSAIKAGYSKKTAKEMGHENLTKPHLQAYLQKRMKDREERTEITQDRVLEELATFGFANIKDFIETGSSDFVTFKNIDKISKESARAIESIKMIKNLHGGSLEFKLHSKSRGLELIGRHLGMFHDSIDLYAEMRYKLSMEELKLSLKKFKKKKG